MEVVARQEILDELARRFELTPEQAESAFEAVFTSIKDQLLQGKTVEIKGFGKLQIVEKKSHLINDSDEGRFVSPTRNIIEFEPVDAFQLEIDEAKLSTIILAVPENDPFAQVIEYHFTQVGWQVHPIQTVDDILSFLKEGGSAHLAIVDHTLEGASRLVAELKSTLETCCIPLVNIYPSGGDPESCLDLQVLGDEHLVEPFEVYTLLMLAESELARATESEILFDQQVNFQFGTTEENLELANEYCQKLIQLSGLQEDDQIQFQTGLREAIGNASQHGNKDNPNKLIKIQYLLDKEKITVVITDEGPGFSHDQYIVRGTTMDAVSAARERHQQGRGGGLGIMMIQKCSDQLEFNETGNSMTLVKYLVSTKDDSSDSDETATETVESEEEMAIEAAVAALGETDSSTPDPEIDLEMSDTPEIHKLQKFSLESLAGESEVDFEPEDSEKVEETEEAKEPEKAEEPEDSEEPEESKEATNPFPSFNATDKDEEKKSGSD